jgi:glucose/mannose-6-phosphate isomerase
MNLDDPQYLKRFDPDNMLGEIDNLPTQLEAAWDLGQKCEAFRASDITRVLISGMGGSAIGADLVSAYISPSCNVPVIVQRDYGLPAWARGAETLFIASSHSGNTEETLDSFNAALKAGCRMLVVCTGGELEKRALAAGIPVWKFEHKGQPRAAVGFSFGLLLAAFSRLGLIAPVEQVTAEVVTTIKAMKKQQAALRVDMLVAQNPAKRMAGQWMGRWVNVFGSGMLAPVARRWKGQINELAKAGAGFEFLPEADHNALAGTQHPAEPLTHTFTVFLHAPSENARSRRRGELTRKAMMVEGLNTDFYEAQGESPLAQMWTAIHFGDYAAYYLAMAYEADPSDTSMLEEFKAGMKATK